jgi:hypothetical protein
MFDKVLYPCGERNFHTQYLLEKLTGGVRESIGDLMGKYQ